MSLDHPQIEAFAPWNVIWPILSLHIRNQHILVPIVHRPSFAQDLLNRRDIQDEPFRGLLLSMGELRVSFEMEGY